MKLVEMSAFRDDEVDPLIEVIRPRSSSQVKPSEAFIYWTRRMLLNVMRNTTGGEESVRRAS